MEGREGNEVKDIQDGLSVCEEFDEVEEEVKVKKKEFLTILGIALIFLVLNISVFTTKFHGDLATQQVWGNYALEHGVSSLYANEMTDYPPLYMFVLKLNAWLNYILFNNTTVGSYPYVFISKTIPTLCNLIIGLGIFVYLQKKDYKKAVISMCIYLFNPITLYNSAYWGQVDSVNALFMFFSILSLIKRRYLLSTLLLTLAVLIKIQSVVILPVVGLIIFMDIDLKNYLKIIFTNATILFLVLFPYWRGGVIRQVVYTITHSADRFPYVVLATFNFWYLFFPIKPGTPWRDIVLDTTKTFGISYRIIGLTLLGTYTLFLVYQIFKNKDIENVVLASASMAFAFFMLPTQIHERYLFPFFSLFALIVLKNKRYLIVYFILSFTHLLNLMKFEFIDKWHIIIYTIQSFLNFLIEKLMFIKVGWAIALINVIVFVYFSKIGIFNNLVDNLRRDKSKIKECLLRWYR